MKVKGGQEKLEVTCGVWCTGASCTEWCEAGVRHCWSILLRHQPGTARYLCSDSTVRTRLQVAEHVACMLDTCFRDTFPPRNYNVYLPKIRCGKIQELLFYSEHVGHVF